MIRQIGLNGIYMKEIINIKANRMNSSIGRSFTSLWKMHIMKKL